MTKTSAKTMYNKSHKRFESLLHPQTPPSSDFSILRQYTSESLWLLWYIVLALVQINVVPNICLNESPNIILLSELYIMKNLALSCSFLLLNFPFLFSKRVKDTPPPNDGWRLRRLKRILAIRVKQPVGNYTLVKNGRLPSEKAIPQSLLSNAVSV